MNKAKRKAIIAGNWKMNKTATETKALVDELLPLVKDKNGCDIIICTPFTDLAVAVEKTACSNVKVGAQNVHYEAKGAFTGEISTSMLLDLDVHYVIIGHSERRQYFGETDKTVNLRTKAAVDAGMNVILCVGELLEQREKGITNDVIDFQIEKDLADITPEQMSQIIIAYEPVWAIGTGLTATPAQAEEVCGYIRSLLAKKYGDDIAQATTIQYGGSMNAGNCAELLAMENIDGGLIGGASLKPKDFSVIVDAAQ